MNTSKKSKKVFQYVTYSNAAPFVSDVDSGFIEAKNAEDALEQVVKNYKHPAGLFAAEIREPTPENPVLARHLARNRLGSRQTLRSRERGE